MQASVFRRGATELAPVAGPISSARGSASSQLGEAERAHHRGRVRQLRGVDGRVEFDLGGLGEAMVAH